MTVTERVENGFKALDQRVPWWREKVNSSILDMHSLKDCVLGQVYESYYVGTLALNLSDDDVINYGFEVTDPSDKTEYDKLTNEWKVRLGGNDATV